MKLTDAIKQLQDEMARAGIDGNFMIVLPHFEDGMRIYNHIRMETAPNDAHLVSDPKQAADRQSLRFNGVKISWPAHGFRLPEFN